MNYPVLSLTSPDTLSSSKNRIFCKLSELRMGGMHRKNREIRNRKFQSRSMRMLKIGKQHYYVRQVNVKEYTRLKFKIIP